MMHWMWFAVAFILGGMFGVGIMALLIAADREDDE